MLFQRNVCAQCVRDDQCETGKFCSYGLCSRIRESKFCSNDSQCYLHFNGDRDYYCTGGRCVRGERCFGFCSGNRVMIALIKCLNQNLLNSVDLQSPYSQNLIKMKSPNNNIEILNP